MITFEDMVKGREELLVILSEVEADAAIESELARLSQVASPVECYAETARLIYANRDTLPKELLDWGARAGATCSVNAFYGMTEEGKQIYEALKQPEPEPAK